MKVVATTRNAQGTGASRRLRHLGKVPGVLYGGKADAQAIEVDHNNLFHALRKEKFHASILDMELDGKSERVLLRAFQMHPYKPQVLHIDFQRVAEDQKIHMRVPLHFVGQENSPAVKVSGGLISHVRSDIDVACLPKDLPEFIEVDLSELKVGHSIHVSAVKLPPGVSVVPHGRTDPVVAAAIVPRAHTETEEAAAGAEGAAAAAAAPTEAEAKAPEKKEEKKDDKKK